MNLQDVNVYIIVYHIDGLFFSTLFLFPSSTFLFLLLSFLPLHISFSCALYLLLLILLIVVNSLLLSFRNPAPSIFFIFIFIFYYGAITFFPMQRNIHIALQHAPMPLPLTLKTFQERKLALCSLSQAIKVHREYTYSTAHSQDSQQTSIGISS